MEKWKWVIFDGAIPHMCSPSLVDVIVADLERRGCPVSEVQDGDGKFTIDMPGMVAVKRPWEDFEFDGLELSIPCEDVDTFVVYIGEDLKERGGEGGRYYKIHGWHRCLVVTPEQRGRLLAVLRDRLPTADRRAREFYATMKPMSQVLREANAAANNVPVEQIPDCGGHKNDRFHPKKRGQS